MHISVDTPQGYVSSKLRLISQWLQILMIRLASDSSDSQYNLLLAQLDSTFARDLWGVHPYD